MNFRRLNQCSIEKKTRDYFISIQPKTFCMLYRHRGLSNNFSVTSPTSWRIRSKCIQKFKQNAMRNMHYSQFLMYNVYTEYCNGNLWKHFLQKTKKWSQNKCFLIFKYSILTSAAPISSAKLGTALNDLPWMAYVSEAQFYKSWRAFLHRS